MSMEAEASSRDLLNRFAGITTDQARPETSSELSLGLSLGGCFSSNPREKTNMLIRSSSISAYPNLNHFFSSSIVKEEAMNIHMGPTGGMNVGPLKRASSMPVQGADEEYKKRKVLQTLKRLEAKRKRNEKRMNCLSKGEEIVWGSRAAGRMLPPLSQGSGSAGSSGSVSASGSPQGIENTLKRVGRGPSGVGDLDMPCVSTRGNGPNGTKIEGFLYKYKRGEEVRIVCVCHGNFLTPAEFVRHAGGGDVDNPMRHIVVNKPSSSLV